MSPLRTEAFHQASHLLHLSAIILIGLERSNFSGNFLTATKIARRFH
jgi:hypothetical protein